MPSRLGAENEGIGADNMGTVGEGYSSNSSFESSVWRKVRGKKKRSRRYKRDKGRRNSNNNGCNGRYDEPVVDSAEKKVFKLEDMQFVLDDIAGDGHVCWDPSLRSAAAWARLAAMSLRKVLNVKCASGTVAEAAVVSVTCNPRSDLHSLSGLTHIVNEVGPVGGPAARRPLGLSDNDDEAGETD